jgi:hypothetical protein
MPNQRLRWILPILIMLGCATTSSLSQQKTTEDALSQVQRRIPNKAPADSANARQADVLEAVLRYQISKMSAASYCVQVNCKDAKEDFLGKLRPAPVKKASSCRSQRYSSKLPLHWIVDKETKQPAVLLHVGQLRFLDTTHAEVEGGYDCGELCMGVGVYRVECDGKSWRVAEFRIEVQS